MGDINRQDEPESGDRTLADIARRLEEMQRELDARAPVDLPAEQSSEGVEPDAPGE